MRSVIISSVILVLIIAFAITNTILVGKMCRTTLSEIEKIETKTVSTENIDKILSDFKKKTAYISLTVNSDTVSDVYAAFAELIGAVRAEDKSSAEISKSRLTQTLTRLLEAESVSLLCLF